MKLNIKNYKCEVNDLQDEIIKKAEDINIVGLIKPSKSAVNTSLDSGIGYTKDLKEYVINQINDKEIFV